MEVLGAVLVCKEKRKIKDESVSDEKTSIRNTICDFTSDFVTLGVHEDIQSLQVRVCVCLILRC